MTARGAPKGEKWVAGKAFPGDGAGDAGKSARKGEAAAAVSDAASASEQQSTFEQLHRAAGPAGLRRCPSLMASTGNNNRILFK